MFKHLVRWLGLTKAPSYEIAPIYETIREEVRAKMIRGEGTTPSLSLHSKDVVRIIQKASPILLPDNLFHGFDLGPGTIHLGEDTQPRYTDYQDFLNTELANLIASFWDKATYQPCWSTQADLLKNYGGLDLVESSPFIEDNETLFINNTIMQVISRAFINSSGTIFSREELNFLLLLEGQSEIVDYVPPGLPDHVPQYLSPIMDEYEAGRTRIMNMYRMTPAMWSALVSMHHVRDNVNMPKVLDYTSVLVEYGYSRSEAKRIVREACRESKRLYYVALEDASETAKANLIRPDFPATKFASGHGTYQID